MIASSQNIVAPATQTKTLYAFDLTFTSDRSVYSTMIDGFPFSHDSVTRLNRLSTSSTSSMLLNCRARPGFVARPEFTNSRVAACSSHIRTSILTEIFSVESFCDIVSNGSFADAMRFNLPPFAQMRCRFMRRRLESNPTLSEVETLEALESRRCRLNDFESNFPLCWS